MAKNKIAREVVESSAEFARKAYDEILDFFGYGADAEEIMSEVNSLTPETRRVVKALQRDDFMGFETPDQALKQFIEDPVYTYENYDVSPQLKGALTKFANNPPSKPKKTMEDVAPRINSGLLGDYDMANSAKTQVTNTDKTYQKARGILDQLGVGDDVIDYGAGKGHGSAILRGESYEPFPQGWTPDYTSPPNKEYEGVVNMNVLNVLPPEIREQVANEVLNSIKKDGYGVVGARSFNDVMTAKNPQILDDGGIMTSRGTYQYGFGGKNEGLVDFLQRMANDIPDKEFEITPEKIAATGAKIRRLKSGALPTVGAGILGQILFGQDEEMY
jgi:hypothetical protein